LRNCLVCENSKKKEIEALLNSGVPLREIERQIGVCYVSLYRHKKNHMNCSNVTINRNSSNVTDETDLNRNNETRQVYNGTYNSNVTNSITNKITIEELEQMKNKNIYQIAKNSGFSEE